MIGVGKFLLFVCVTHPVTCVLGLSLERPQVSSGRRGFVQKIVAVAASSTFTTGASALDMDAFANSQLDSKKELTSDEALCKYGQPSPATGEACVRAGMSTERSKGGVDAFGTRPNRGDFVRCKFPYAVVDGKYQKQRICE
jgi:hypothetical protein